MMKYLQFFVLLITFSFYSISAQESQLSSGKTVKGPGGSVSYSIGQPFIYSMTGEHTTISPGVQQPFEISIETALDHTDQIELYFKAYPNPATNKLFISVEGGEFESLKYQVVDISGKTLMMKEITQDVTTVETGDLQPSTYFVQLIHQGIPIKIFKIIKNQ